ncbi:MAG TPA: response regulator transcription factor [Verrucomicrobiae bacterium]|nr:response regulator transcription factor [Verrucomicrobiae bacterium]
MKKVLVADDHAIYREGLKQIIGMTVDMVVADEACDGQEALRKVRENDYDVVILDISMPGRSGLEVLAEMKTAKPKLPVLVLSMHPEEQYAIRAFRTGASGYVTKGSAPQELVEALEKVVLGKKHVSPSLAEALVAGLDDPGHQPLHARLSNREYQVLCMIGSGKPVGRIAGELSLSVKTVSTYRTMILRKLNLRNNAEITRYAIENSLT